jgi:hypothetical protein
VFFFQSADDPIDVTERRAVTLHLLDDKAFELPSMGGGDGQ